MTGAVGGEVVLRGRQIDELLGKLMGKAVTALVVLLAASGVQMFRHGISERYVLLVGGGVLSAAALFGYAMLAIRKERHGVLRIAAIGGFVPYVFGCYLVFYEGLWRLRHLLEGFSFSVLLVGGFFIVIGYATVSGIYKVSELGRRVDEGDIIIE